MQINPEIGQQEIGCITETPSDAQELIKDLANSRNRTLRLYYALAGIEPFSKDVEDQGRSLQNFCQYLVDYTAAGHFSLIQPILEKEGCGQDLKQNVLDLLPSLSKTTDVILRFNDHYDCDDHCKPGENFRLELQQLGIALANRMELEDKITDLFCHGCNNCLSSSYVTH